MDLLFQSILPSISILGLLALVALWLTLKRTHRFRSPSEKTRFLKYYGLCILGQSIHFIEELSTGFYAQFPQALDLEPMPISFFIVFNVAWIVIWIGCGYGMYREKQIAFFPVWFLALAMALNGIAHPALALQGQGYFSGLYTAPIVGLLGLWLCVRLWRLREG